MCPSREVCGCVNASTSCFSRIPVKSEDVTEAETDATAAGEEVIKERRGCMKEADRRGSEQDKVRECKRRRKGEEEKLGKIPPSLSIHSSRVP